MGRAARRGGQESGDAGRTVRANRHGSDNRLFGAGGDAPLRARKEHHRGQSRSVCAAAREADGSDDFWPLAIPSPMKIMRKGWIGDFSAERGHQ